MWSQERCGALESRVVVASEIEWSPIGLQVPLLCRAVILGVMHRVKVLILLDKHPGTGPARVPLRVRMIYRVTRTWSHGPVLPGTALRQFTVSSPLTQLQHGSLIEIPVAAVGVV